MKKALFLIINIWILLLSAEGFAQDKPSGALDFGIDFHHSAGGRNVLGIHTHAMAVDRVPGTLVGRFGEGELSLGIGLKGELVQYSARFKLGVGLGTDYLVIFLASGLMTDAYHKIKSEFSEEQVKPGLGLPLMLGIWVDPMPGLYVYMTAEPSWSFWGGDRKTTPYVPFNWAWELRLRGGIGFDISQIHIRMEYTFHQVDPYSWHVVSIGFGYSSKSMAALGMTPIKND